MRTLVRAVMVLATPALLAAQAPLEVGRLTFGPARQVAELDMGRLKGEPARLAWSPDGTQLYFQSVEGGYGTPKATHHYLIDVASGKRADLQVEPEWFSPYWTVKSHKNSPDVPGLVIDLSTEQRREQTTAVPRGGDLARGGTTTELGTSAEDATKAAYGSQMVTTHTMKLKGEPIGEFVNSVIVPGLTFAWGPKGTQVIAYSTVKGGRLQVMDAEGKKQEVPNTKDALLPAWSQDATKLAWLQKDGKRKLVLKIAEVR
ncbi:MAG TPA: hypothetical protein VM364_16365 [Vicinamibacterales bacterium]|nr:hypothetical protein [Vicinamibacterales bacterium]